MCGDVPDAEIKTLGQSLNVIRKLPRISAVQGRQRRRVSSCKKSYFVRWKSSTRLFERSSSKVLP